jgi:flagellin-like protein
MSGHFNNKRMWNKKGVSEVIGTLLILAITVVLFSGVIYMVGNIPTPQDNVNTTLQGTIEPVNGTWDDGAYVNISNKGGIVLKGSWTDIVLIIGNTSSHLVTKSYTPAYGIDGDADEDWETGETWHYVIPAHKMDNSTQVSVMIIASDRSAIVWQADLRPSGTRNYPPVIMTVTVESERDGLINNYIQYNEPFTIKARIIDFDSNLDPATVWADMSSMGLGFVKLTDNLDGQFFGTATGPLNKDLYAAGAHPVIINATDLDGAYTSKTVYPSLGGEFTGIPMITILEKDITFGDGTLVHNKKAEITATIYNYGASVEASVFFYDGSVSTSNLIGNRSVPILLHANAQVRAYMDWTPGYGGMHNIIVNVTPTNPALDGDWSNNQADINVTVQPTILLVDDDGHANDKTDEDTSSFMRAALSAGNFDYDFVSIAVGDGPGYNTGDNKMINYDVVVWMCGYATSSTLTNTDVANLKKYLTDTTGGRNNTGSLWLIGQGVLADPVPTTGAGAFVTNNLKIASAPWTNKIPMATSLTGSSINDPVASYLATGSISIIQRGSMPTNGYVITNTTPGFNSLVNPTTPSDCYGVGAAVDSIKSRTYFTPWEFSRIKETSDQAQLAYQVIRWLGDINSSFGRDLSVSEQSVDKDVVYFHQPVSITGIVRNNGMRNETNVTVSVTIYYAGLPTTLPEVQVNVPNTIGSNWISVGPFLWTPENVGYHSIVLMVDPHNDIPESNEENNVVSNYLSSGSIDVQFRLLVVDDDESANNMGARTNDTLDVTNVFKTLGYFNESVVVNTTQAGPAYSDLKDYNAVVWSTGSAPNALLLQDTQNLTTYLNGGGRLWLTGRNGLSTGASLFQQGYLGVASASTAVATPTTLLGIDGNDISHGDRYSMNVTSCQNIVKTFDASGTFLNGPAFNGVNVSKLGFKTVTTAFALSDVTGSTEYPGDTNARVELAYMIMHWFGAPDARVEFRTTLSDFAISSARPQLGDSYVLQARIHNVGGSDGNCLVRFMDGTTQIGSDSITVSADGYTTAEVIWTPLFAGQRTLYVLVDPINETAEIIDNPLAGRLDFNNQISYMGFNNRIHYSTYVYFFYDDMENGTSKWNHDSTIALINGEQPLDYISNTVVTMNIEKSWDAAMSDGISNSTDVGYYHTYGKSYWLQEPSGAGGTTTVVKQNRKPMDIVFCIDTSGSMAQDLGTRSKIEVAIEATQIFIYKLNDTDRASVYTFDGSGDPYLLHDWLWMDETNRDHFANDTVAVIGTAGYTPFYDTLGEAVNHALTYDATGTDSTRYEYVVGLTDGVSNRDHTYTPNCNWGSTISTNQYTDDTNSHYHTMSGLIEAPPMVYTVGLGTDHDNDYPTAPDWSYTPPDITAHNQEYDLWHCANSTPDNPTGGNFGWNNTTLPHRPNVGHYYYCTQADQLLDVFSAIFTSISSIGSTNVSGENITRSGNWQPPTRSGGWEGTNSVPPGPTPNAVAASMPSANVAGAWNTPANGYSTNTVYTTTPTTPGPYVHDWRGYNLASIPVGSTINGIEVVLNGTASVGGAGNQITVSLTKNGGGGYTAGILTAAITTTRTPYTVGGVANLWGYTWTDAELKDATNFRVRLSYSVTGGRSASVDAIFVRVTYTAPVAATATASGPTGGPTNVAPITITYTRSGTPTSVNIYYTTNGGTSWALAGNDATPLDGYPYTLTVSGTYGWIAAAVGGGSTELSPPAPGTVPESTSYIFDNVEPYVLSTVPPGTWTGIALAQNIVITFSETMTVGSFAYTVAPNPGGLAVAWSGAIPNSIATISHTAFQPNTRYWVNITNAADPSSNPLDPTPYSFYFDTVLLASATVTGPVGGPTNVAAITITYTWTLTPTSVYIYYTTNGGTTWISAGLSDTTIDGSYPFTCPAAGTYGWIALAHHAILPDEFPGAIVPPASGTAPEASSYVFDNVSPTITVTSPANAATGIATAASVVITFSEAMNTGSFAYSCTPDPGGWAVAWNVANTIATMTHTVYTGSTLYTFTVTVASDVAGNALIAGVAPNPFSFTTVNQASATATGPTGPSNVAAITIAYTFSSTPTSVNIYYTMNGGTTWTLAGNDATVDGSYAYTIATVDGTYGWRASAVGGGTIETSPPAAGTVPEATPYILDRVKPASACVVSGAYWRNVAITITATATDAAPSSGIASVTLYYRYSLNNATWGTWKSFGSDMLAPWSWGFNFPSGNGFYEFYTMARDAAGNVENAPLVADLRHGYITSSSGGNSGISPPGANTNKTAVTKAMNLTNIEEAELSFWHKYNIVPGVNGGFLEVGFKESATGAWKWKYVVPSSAYTGNLRLNQTGRTDSYGTFVQWGWNGVSGRGTFAWEKVNINLLDWVALPNGSHFSGSYDLRSSVRVKFNYTQYGGGTGYGWYIDDVKVAVSRSDDLNSVNTASADVWQQVTTRDRNNVNTTAWWNGNITSGFMKRGIDNSLMCGPIDLTNARNAVLNASFKFNINTKDGAPPDGFRVEISKDNGMSWSAINLGVRAAWNVSGSEFDTANGQPHDHKSYSGINSGNYWVYAESLSRLNVDLSSFTGNAIMLRFRVVNNNINNDSPINGYAHYKSNTVGFGGFYIDDVTVTGNTILG